MTSQGPPDRYPHAVVRRRVGLRKAVRVAFRRAAEADYSPFLGPEVLTGLFMGIVWWIRGIPVDPNVPPEDQFD